ncbi:hypothetical protein BG55_19565 [Erwinia mallotivora]|uniref:Uncharacterized protein n=1 Tax=Erwinia mallotivora TaxID=69222 RepID=A0A014M7E3_9GAMM|nr:hypothetical protein BG55_19565 [Erwinia mallotivora]
MARSQQAPNQPWSSTGLRGADHSTDSSWQKGADAENHAENTEFLIRHQASQNQSRQLQDIIRLHFQTENLFTLRFIWSVAPY